MTSNVSRKGMPPKSRILKHWSNNKTFEHYEVEINESDADCFACGNHIGVQRAHIKPLCEGGDNSLDNLHLLCAGCHVESEPLSGDSYWRWLSHKNINHYETSIERVANKMLVTPSYYIESLRFLLGCEKLLTKYGLTKQCVESIISEQERLIEIDSRS